MANAATQQPVSTPGSAAGRHGVRVPSLASLLAGAMLAALVAAVPLAIVSHQATAGGLAIPLLMVPFAGVGVVVASRQPGNPIGWILTALALIVTLGSDGGYYSVLAYRVDQHGLPLSRLAVVLASGWIALFVLLPLPILLFPNGRLPERGWRWTLWAYMAGAAVFVVSIGVNDVAAFTERHVTVDTSGEIASLNGSTGTMATLGNILFFVLAAIALAWVIRQVLRYRRSAGDERQQHKWLMSGGAVSILGLVVAAVFSSGRSPFVLAIGHAGFIAVATLPLSIGVGILKYRLYEIDRLISRTISYAIVTGLLVGVFVGIVALTTEVLPISSPVGVAASTLVAAALFNPLRRRVQRLVDRRFNRARYDAEATVVAFAGRLRDAIDLDTISRELLDAVDQTLAPAHASLWLRPSGEVAPVSSSGPE